MSECTGGEENMLEKFLLVEVMLCMRFEEVQHQSSAYGVLL